MVHQMGAEAVVGDLAYNVTQAEWRDALDGVSGARVANARFLLVSISISNRGREAAHVPLLALVDKAGKETLESDKGDGVPQWMGLLRTVEPGESHSGTILFDVAGGEYKLKITSGGDVEKEVTALVELKSQGPAAPANPAEGLPSPPTK
ncbi:MAG: DUF4352 domain-containing protein [Acidobacteria bacterium]|nr:DUF4352 domain-containing protein [Acidobacteriota bacterium]